MRTVDDAERTVASSGGVLCTETTSWVWDAAGPVTETVEAGTDDLVTAYVHDVRGNRTTAVDPRWHAAGADPDGRAIEGPGTGRDEGLRLVRAPGRPDRVEGEPCGDVRCFPHVDDTGGDATAAKQAVLAALVQRFRDTGTHENPLLGSSNTLEDLRLAVRLIYAATRQPDVRAWAIERLLAAYGLDHMPNVQVPLGEGLLVNVQANSSDQVLHPWIEQFLPMLSSTGHPDGPMAFGPTTLEQAAFHETPEPGPRPNRPGSRAWNIGCGLARGLGAGDVVRGVSNGEIGEFGTGTLRSGAGLLTGQTFRKVSEAAVGASAHAAGLGARVFSTPVTVGASAIDGLCQIGW